MWQLLGSSALSILIGGLGIALGALIVWGAVRLWQLIFGKRPDFVLSKRAPDYWELRRTKRSTAYVVVTGNGIQGGGDASQLHSTAVGQTNLGDLRRGDVVGVPVSPGASMVWFAWIDRRRLYSRSVDLAKADTYEIRGVRPSKDGAYRT